MTFQVEPVERHVVDNRLFIIGLDDLYRSSMKKLEATGLLDCARTVARELGASPSSGPVEGYYGESAALTEYFQLIRSLQEFDDDSAPQVARLPEFSRLHAIATSGCYGHPEPGKLLPKGADPLTRAMDAIPPGEWSVDGLTERACTIATTTGDFSLVGLAARTRDPVLVAATRESVSLYALRSLGSEEPSGYDWQVDDDLARAANQFIQAFNQFGGNPLPPAEAASAEIYCNAASHAHIAGRCIAIGHIPGSGQYYHWAIAGGRYGPVYVKEFWDREMWTTSRYEAQQLIKNEW